MKLEPLNRLLEQAGLAITVDRAAGTRLSAFVDRRHTWSKIHNLAGPSALEDPWGTDVLDGVAVAQILAPDLPLVDVGAGGGVPGLVVACLEPQRPIHLVEPRTKRAAFLRLLTSELGLRAVQIHRARWPLDLGVPAQVVSRAVVSPRAWPALATEAPARTQALIRMLAEDRPPVTLSGATLAQALDYHGRERALRVERWQLAGFT